MQFDDKYPELRFVPGDIIHAWSKAYGDDPAAWNVQYMLQCQLLRELSELNDHMRSVRLHAGLKQFQDFINKKD